MDFYENTINSSENPIQKILFNFVAFKYTSVKKFVANNF
jgi:hypothetical protein